MRTRRIVAVSLLACAIAAAGLLPAASTLAAPGQKEQNTASQSYYRLDVPNGTIEVRVDATVQNAQSKDMTVATLWAMPQAQSITVTQGNSPLDMKVTPASSLLPTRIQVTLPRSLKQNARMDLEMRYTVPAQNSETERIEPGAMEIALVSQGPGSFVLVDVPLDGENYFDPGCMKVADQPGDVKSAGLERWMCGEASAAALGQDLESVQKRCANLDDSCRQRKNISPWSAVAQSVTDLSKRGLLEADVQLEQRSVHMTFRYFKKDQAWAEKQFQVATAALPRLEQTFGFPYQFESLKLRQSHHIGMAGAAGVAFLAGGDVLIAPQGGGFSEEVTVHELAHQWAGGNFGASWLNEGLAEYGMRVVAPELGITPYDRGWQSQGTGALGAFESTWDIIETNPDYWYGKAGAFWFEYEAAIGGREAMRTVLGLSDDYKNAWPLDGRWFMDAGERVSGANLDALFKTWVWDTPAADASLAERRAAHNAVAPVRARAAEFGFEGLPEDIQDNLNHWAFRSVEGQVTEANALLDDYAKLLAEATAAGLPPIDNMKNSWNTGTMRETRGVIADQGQALDAIVNSTKVLEGEKPGSPSMKQLEEARLKYAEGDLDEAARLAAMSATTAFNQDASLKLIALAKEKQASFKPSFLGRIGMLWQDPEGKLRQAEEAYAAGDPTKSFELAESAYQTWDTADRTGLQRLAILMGAMCLLCGGVFWLLRRLDGPDLEIKIDPYAAKGGHDLGDPEGRRPSWRDWENTNH